MRGTQRAQVTVSKHIMGHAVWRVPSKVMDGGWIKVSFDTWQRSLFQNSSAQREKRQESSVSGEVSLLGIVQNRGRKLTKGIHGNQLKLETWLLLNFGRDLPSPTRCSLPSLFRMNFGQLTKKATSHPPNIYLLLDFIRLKINII